MYVLLCTQMYSLELPGTWIELQSVSYCPSFVVYLFVCLFVCLLFMCTCQHIVSMQDHEGIYVDLTSDPVKFLTLVNINGTGHTHLAWVTSGFSDKQVEFITSGDYEVTDIVRVSFDGAQIDSV